MDTVGLSEICHSRSFESSKPIYDAFELEVGDKRINPCSWEDLDSLRPYMQVYT